MRDRAGLKIPPQSTVEHEKGSEGRMVSPVGGLSYGSGSERAVRNKIAKLAKLQLELSACEEQLNGVDRQPSSGAAKESERKLLTAKMADLKAQIAELSRADTSPAARAEEEEEDRRRPREQRAKASVLDTVRLAMVKEGHLGTFVNLRA